MINRKPRKGDKVAYKGKYYSTVLRVEDNICILEKNIDDNPNKGKDLFIWRFLENGKEVLNNLFTIIEN